MREQIDSILIALKVSSRNVFNEGAYCWIRAVRDACTIIRHARENYTIIRKIPTSQHQIKQSLNAPVMCALRVPEVSANTNARNFPGHGIFNRTIISEDVYPVYVRQSLNYYCITIVHTHTVWHAQVYWIYSSLYYGTRDVQEICVHTL